MTLRVGALTYLTMSKLFAAAIIEEAVGLDGTQSKTIKANLTINLALGILYLATLWMVCQQYILQYPSYVIKTYTYYCSSIACIIHSNPK